MKKISGFDLVMIIVFVVILLLGGGAWYYLSSQLDATKQVVSSNASDFDKYSNREVFLPTARNVKTLQDNIDLMQAQLDPVIHTRLQAPGDKLATVEKEDTVAWKHDLDAEVARLNSAAKLHGVTVPPNFYYGFSRYLNQNPGDEQTVVLSKQLLGVEEIANIFIDAPVRAIVTFRRTYEEDAAGASPVAGGNNLSHSDSNVLPGRAETAPGDVYIAYPFEIEFETGIEGFRKVIDDLQKSPYVFVVRSLMVQNSSPASPQISDLDKIAGDSGPSVADTAPGGVGASKSSRGPQFLFGNETLHVKVRIDMIEWKGISNGSTAPAGGNRGGGRGGRGGAGANR
jgi:hypothetical protein